MEGSGDEKESHETESHLHVKPAEESSEAATGSSHTSLEIASSQKAGDDSSSVASADSLGHSKHRAGFLKTILGKVSAANWEEDKDLNVEGHGYHRGQKGYWLTTLFLSYQALGIVYGDIGTSPLYVFASTFKSRRSSEPPAVEDILGVASLIIYALTVIIVIKYCLIVLRADDHGNGGTFALYSLLKRSGDFRTFGAATIVDQSVSGYRELGPKFSEPSLTTTDWRKTLLQSKTSQFIIRTLVVIGVGAIMGDGVLTPAITVVSACEGIRKGVSGFSNDAVVGLSLAIIACLFLIQRFGTEKVGVTFSPIVIVWFTFNLVVGIINIAQFDATVFRAFSPHYIVKFFIRNKADGWRMLGGILLAITGAEALYADLGHFNRDAVIISCFGLVYPTLVITYLGQAAFLLKHPDKYEDVFWDALPKGTFWPMLVAATFAAIVASQALISAVFQIVYQAIRQDFFPKFQIIHTSKEIIGQVYVPVINYMLMALTLIVVATFKSSEKLGQAYGLAVIIDMLLTCHFVTLVMVSVWRVPLYYVVPFYFFYTLVEGAFLSSSIEKIPKGGWFSLMMASIYAAIMLLWFAGQRGKREYFNDRAIEFQNLLAVEQGPDRQEKLYLNEDRVEVMRCPGVGIYYNDSIRETPPVLVEQLRAYHTVHQVSIFMTNRHVSIPKVNPKDSLLVNQLGMSGFYHAVARYGYMDRVVQGPEYVSHLLAYVQHLLLRGLFHCLATSEGLRAEVLTPEQSAVLGLTSNAGIEDTARALEALDTIDAQNADMPALTGGQADDTMHLSTNMQHTIGASAKGMLHPLLTLGKVTPMMREVLVVVAQQLVAGKDKVLGDKGSVSKMDRALNLSEEIQIVKNAQKDGTDVHYVFARSYVRPTKDSSWLKRYVLEIPYDTMVKNFSEDAHRLFNVPVERVIEMGLGYEV